MKALITGATSGIGRDMAAILSGMGFDLILASRNMEKMKQVKKHLRTNVRLIQVDLSKEKDCYKLYEQTKNEKITVLINNAGFGKFGKFWDIPLETELNMLDLNARGVHILTKLFLNDFRERNSGYIMNVASSAAFLPGPLLSAYYATKSYVLRLTEGIYEELRQEGSQVHVCVLCPGPVDTGFNERADVKFSLPGMSSKRVAAYAVDKMFRGKLVIIPGVTMKIACVGERFLSDRVLARMAYSFQRKKKG